MLQTRRLEVEIRPADPARESQQRRPPGQAALAGQYIHNDGPAAGLVQIAVGISRPSYERPVNPKTRPAVVGIGAAVAAILVESVHSSQGDCEDLAQREEPGRSGHLTYV